MIIMRLKFYLLFTATTALWLCYSTTAFSLSPIVVVSCYPRIRKMTTSSSPYRSTTTTTLQPNNIPFVCGRAHEFQPRFFAARQQQQQQQQRDPYDDEDDYEDDDYDGEAFFKPWSPDEPEVEVSESDKRMFLFFIMTPFLLQVVIFLGIFVKEQLGL